MNLRRSILKWDGKSASELEQIYDDFKNQPDFVDDLLNLVLSSETEVVATWEIKRHLEKGALFNVTQQRKLLKAMTALTHWQAQLHSLQCLDRFSIDEMNRPGIERFVRLGLVHGNKFVRAWSYNGLAVLARQFSELKEEAQCILEMGLKDEPASVKARIRQQLKQGL